MNTIRQKRRKTRVGLAESRTAKSRTSEEAIWQSLLDGRAAGRPFGLVGANRPLSFRLLHVMEFTGDGEINRENVWLDLAAIIQQLPQTAEAVAA